jgi:hypothetical protein
MSNLNPLIEQGVVARQIMKSCHLNALGDKVVLPNNCGKVGLIMTTPKNEAASAENNSGSSK